MSHAVADCFQIDKRGYLDEGYWADVAIVDVNKKWTVSKENILYKCNWSPLENVQLLGAVETTIVSGHLAYHNHQINENIMGKRLIFNR